MSKYVEEHNFRFDHAFGEDATNEEVGLWWRVCNSTVLSHSVGEVWINIICMLVGPRACVCALRSMWIV